MIINLTTYSALELLDLLLPWRHTANEALAIQIQVFKESHAEDSGHLDKPGGVNVNSHEDLFHAVLNKVSHCQINLSLSLQSIIDTSGVFLLKTLTSPRVWGQL